MGAKEPAETRTGFLFFFFFLLARQSESTERDTTFLGRDWNETTSGAHI